MEMFNSAMTIISNLCIAAGTFFVAWGVVGISTALSNHQGSAVQDNAWKLISGIGIYLAAALFSSITIGS